MKFASGTACPAFTSKLMGNCPYAMRARAVAALLAEDSEETGGDDRTAAATRTLLVRTVVERSNKLENMIRAITANIVVTLLVITFVREIGECMETPSM